MSKNYATTYKRDNISIPSDKILLRTEKTELSMMLKVGTNSIYSKDTLKYLMSMVQYACSIGEYEVAMNVLAITYGNRTSPFRNYLKIKYGKGSESDLKDYEGTVSLNEENSLYTVETKVDVNILEKRVYAVQFNADNEVEHDVSLKMNVKGTEYSMSFMCYTTSNNMLELAVELLKVLVFVMEDTFSEVGVCM